MPGALRLTDGYSTIVSLLGNDDTLVGAMDFRFVELDVKPMGVDGGPMINLTSMRNALREMFTPKVLKRTTELTMKVACVSDAFDPAYLDIAINKIQGIVVGLPDNSTYGFMGSLLKWEPADWKEGNQPEINVTIGATNRRHIPIGDASPLDEERRPLYKDPTQPNITLADLLAATV